MDIDQLTVADLKKIAKMMNGFGSDQESRREEIPPMLSIGNAVFVETVAKYFTGRVVTCTPEWLTLDTAAWIADTRRYADFIKDGPSSLAEIEPVGLVAIRIDAIINTVPWPHELPITQKP